MAVVDARLVVAAVAVALGAISQAVTGFGFSLLSAPFLVAAGAAPRGVEWNLILSAGLNVALVSRGWRFVRWSDVGRLLPAALLATIVGGYVARRADRDVLTIVAGIVCLAATVAVVAGWRRHRPPSATGAFVAGGASGAMNVVAGIGGPPVVMYGVTAGWPPDVARSTLQAFFLAINVVAVPSLGLAVPPLALVLALGVGAAAGLVLARRLPAGVVRSAVLVISAGGSVLAILRGGGVY